MNKSFLSTIRNLTMFTVLIGLFLAFPVVGLLAAEETDFVQVSDSSLSIISNNEIDSSISDNSRPAEVEQASSEEASPVELSLDDSNGLVEISVIDQSVEGETEIVSTSTSATSTDLIQTEEAIVQENPAISSLPMIISKTQDSLLGEIKETLESIIVAISNESVFTTSQGGIIPMSDNDPISGEYLFETSNDSENGDSSTSGEGTFQTEEAGTTDGGALSEENNFQTSSTQDETVVISAQMSFTTETSGGGGETTSAEQYFNTLSGPVVPNVGDEGSFVTLSSPIEPPTETVSDQFSFDTLGGPVVPNVSDEYSFLTASTPIEPPSNISAENSFATTGGGGGGGGGGSTITTVTPLYSCPIYLKKFIRYGRNNDSFEVLKLQLFLKYFEGYDVPVTGYYDLKTFRAVEDFQKRYLKDVLTPWGIADPTGYVYITTTLAINSIYCGRDTANSLDLRDLIEAQYQEITGQPLWVEPETEIQIEEEAEVEARPIEILVPYSEPMTSFGVSRLLSALGVLGQFIGDNLCWLLNLLLLAIILFLLWLLWRGDGDDNQPKSNGSSVLPEETLTESDREYLSDLAREELEKEELAKKEFTAQAVGAGVIYLGATKDKQKDVSVEGAVPLEALFENEEESDSTVDDFEKLKVLGSEIEDKSEEVYEIKESEEEGGEEEYVGKKEDNPFQEKLLNEKDLSDEAKS